MFKILIIEHVAPFYFKLIMKGILDFKSPKVDYVISDYLFTSDFYQIKNWSFNFGYNAPSSNAYNDCFCIVFANCGEYSFDISKNKYYMHTGHIIIEKANFEYKIKPSTTGV